MGIGISLWGFPFEKGFYYILADYFQKSKIYFSKKSFSVREAVRYFHGALPFSSHALSLSSHALQLSFICKHRVAKFKFRYISIYFHIYICYVWKKSFPFIKDCMTYIPFLSQTRAPHFWRSHISLGISSPHLQMPRYKHR